MFLRRFAASLFHHHDLTLNNLEIMTTQQILSNAKETGLISEREINLLKNRSNREGIDLISYVDFEPLQVSSEQTEKGLSWLLNKWKTPAGKERKNNPFGYREQEVLSDPNAKAYFNGFWDAGNYTRFFVPIYEYVGGGTSFEYYVSGGEIHIIG